MDAIALRPLAERGAATRNALLDAAESLIAAHGFTTPSHRMIAGQARTHVALLNYHFGSKATLFDAAVGRHSARLNGAWRDALAQVRGKPVRSVGDVVAAWWRPFATLDRQHDTRWANYLCTFARLASAADGESSYQRYFGVADRDFQQALLEVLPDAQREDIEAGLRYARGLLCEILLHRCGKAGGSNRSPLGFRDGDAGRALRYVEAGLCGIAQGER